MRDICSELFRNNKHGWENFSSTCVLSNMTYIVSLYWGSLRSYFTCILSIKYITWQKIEKALTEILLLEGTMCSWYDDDKFVKIQRNQEYCLYAKL